MELRGLLAVGLSALIPEFSALSAQKDWQRIKALNARSRKLVMMTGGALYVPLLIGASIFLHVWLQGRYVEPLALVFRIALVGSFLSLLGVPPYYSLMGLGHTRACLNSHIIQSVVNVIVVIGTLFVAGYLSPAAFAVAVSVGYGCSTLYLLYKQYSITERELAAT